MSKQFTKEEINFALLIASHAIKIGKNPFAFLTFADLWPDGLSEENGDAIRSQIKELGAKGYLYLQWSDDHKSIRSFALGPAFQGVIKAKRN